MKIAVAKTLSQIEEGQTVGIIGINGCRELRGRLTAMGLLPKTKIRMIRNGKSGPFVISVKNSRMALGRGIADKIMVM